MGSDKVVLVTGATGNIGGGAALALVRRGVKTVLLGRKPENLERRADAIRAALSESGISFRDDDISALVVDFTDMEAVKRASAEALERFPVIDALILSVGRILQNGPHVLPGGHEAMFATSVIGPFLFTQYLMDRLICSNGLILQVIAPFYEKIDWDDLESINKHKTSAAYNRAKTCERVLTGELARRYAGRISSVAFNPSFIIDKSDPELNKRWPEGLFGYFWRVLALLFSRPPEVAGEPIADIILSAENRRIYNGALYKLGRRINRPDKAMNDTEAGKRLWNALHRLTDLY